MTKQLSIIIPVYNGEEYIESCLKSVTQQLQPGVELIVINDGSVDGTHQLLSTVFKSHMESGQLTYLPTANAGVSAARNLGLDHATGTYVAFVDADDLLAHDYVATILAAIAKAPAIIEFGCRLIDQHGSVLKDRIFAHKKFGTHADGEIIDTVFTSFLWYPVIRAFKRDLFDNVRFPVGVRFCEDLMALSEIYKLGGVVLTLPNVLYNYRIHSTGATLNPKADYVTNLVEFYRVQMNQNDFPSKALRINLAYAARSCLIKKDDPLGRLPKDIERDVLKLVFSPRILLIPRRRVVMYALFGPSIRRLKLLFKLGQTS